MLARVIRNLQAHVFLFLFPQCAERSQLVAKDHMVLVITCGLTDRGDVTDRSALLVMQVAFPLQR